ncbi:enoyl-CoA delta isomerase 2 [Drosophila bipectinata]|uniref:enoyl-CoA delta isomerase 2 n=1 Tax=Drosophila bipectinata TaxID=42026 RepID=UPI001C8A7E62|nr:enoyl-CoA delta isomerase 2 [Drosophila bipectinata]KAH8269847.1 hypothetical protein KR026_009419 [Drosophila bipectinata]
MAAGADFQHFGQLSVGRISPGVLRIQFGPTWQRRTVYELMRALDLATKDEDIRIVVLCGNFSIDCGGDSYPLELKQGLVKRTRQRASEAIDHPDPVEEQYIHEKAANFVMRSLAKKLLGYRKLLVAFVDGRCLGLGFSVSSLCDLVYATESATFHPAFSHLDSCAAVGPNWTLPHIRGLLLLGEQADAGSARNSGLVAGVVKDPQEFWNRIEQYSHLPPSSLLATKKLMLRPWRDALLAELREESTPLASQRRRLARPKL